MELNKFFNVFNVIVAFSAHSHKLIFVLCTNALFNDFHDQSFNVQSRKKLEIKRSASFLADLYLRRSKSAPV